MLLLADVAESKYVQAIQFRVIDAVHEYNPPKAHDVYGYIEYVTNGFAGVISFMEYKTINPSNRPATCAENRYLRYKCLESISVYLYEEYGVLDAINAIQLSQAVASEYTPLLADQAISSIVQTTSTASPTLTPDRYFPSIPCVICSSNLLL